MHTHCKKGINGTFKTTKADNIELSFVEFSASKLVHVQPDIVEHPKGSARSLYDMIIGKQTLHDIDAVLDFKENIRSGFMPHIVL